MVFSRPYYHDVKESWFISFMKLSYFERKDGRDCSFFKIAYAEIQQVIEIIMKLLDEIFYCPPEEMPERLKNSPFKDSDDRKNVAEFWSKAHTEYTNSGKLGIRQHRDSEGIYTLRFFAPIQNSKYEDWHGKLHQSFRKFSIDIRFIISQVQHAHSVWDTLEILQIFSQRNKNILPLNWLKI